MPPWTPKQVRPWGRGVNGRLGHGDIEDRKTATPIEALKDRHVKYISSGSNYTTTICLHKWVSRTKQSQCSSCRQAFGFPRKRHNCCNCGIVHRACDFCFVKFSKMVEAGVRNTRNVMPRIDKSEMRSGLLQHFIMIQNTKHNMG